jgi:hypothetical protein
MLARIGRSIATYKRGTIVETAEMHNKIGKYLLARLTYDYSTSHD